MFINFVKFIGLTFLLSLTLSVCYTRPMIIIPAIDILNGSCVRLLKGNYDESTIYTSNPVEMADKLVRSG